MASKSKKAAQANVTLGRLAQTSQMQIHNAHKAKRAALVIAGTMGLWLLLQLIGAQYDWPPKYALLVDLAALAGFIWGLVITYKIWRKSPSRRG